jgi:CheY-like chemotaxis protein
MTTPLSGLCVLVVDDHSDSRDIFEHCFAHLGARVIAVSTAEAGLARIAEADVLVTDYLLPGRDGVWLLEQARAVKELPVVLVSGFTGSQVPAVAAAPFTLKILKPIDPLELGWQIALVMGRARNT